MSLRVSKNSLTNKNGLASQERIDNVNKQEISSVPIITFENSIIIGCVLLVILLLFLIACFIFRVCIRRKRDNADEKDKIIFEKEKILELEEIIGAGKYIPIDINQKVGDHIHMEC